MESPTVSSFTPQEEESCVKVSVCDALRVHNVPSGTPSGSKTIVTLPRAGDSRSVRIFVSPEVVPESSDKVSTFLGKQAVSERRQILQGEHF